MTLATIRAGIKTALEGVPGVSVVLSYPPKSIPANKSIFFSLTGLETVRSGQVRGVRWEFTVRLVLLWQDAEQGEADLDAMVRGVIQAIDDDAHLGGAITAGLAEVLDGETGWFQTEGSASWYRYCDFTLTVLDKTVT